MAEDDVDQTPGSAVDAKHESTPDASLLPDSYNPLADTFGDRLGDGPDTAAMPTLDPLRSTRELPPVREPLVKPFAVDSSLTGLFEPSPLPGELPPPAPVGPPPATPPGGEPVATTGPASSGPASGPAPRSGPRTPIVLVGLALILLVALAAWLVPRGDDAPQAAPSATPTTAAPLEVALSSLDPVGGSGFRTEDGGWVTQTYKTADFGNLKKGVGLILDLGSQKSVGAVTFTGDGFTAQLRSADTPSDDPGDWTPAGAATTAAAATTLRGSGAGAHQYWLIWVTKLANHDDGYAARITDVQVTS